MPDSTEFLPDLGEPIVEHHSVVTGNGVIRVLKTESGKEYLQPLIFRAGMELTPLPHWFIGQPDYDVWLRAIRELLKD